jgi:hypothetical protein
MFVGLGPLTIAHREECRSTVAVPAQPDAEDQFAVQPFENALGHGIARLEKAHGAGAWRTVVVTVPYGMSDEAALTQLGIQTKDFGRLILITDYRGPRGLPRLVSGDEGAG